MMKIMTVGVILKILIMSVDGNSKYKMTKNVRSKVNRKSFNKVSLIYMKVKLSAKGIMFVLNKRDSCSHNFITKPLCFESLSYLIDEYAVPQRKV